MVDNLRLRAVKPLPVAMDPYTVESGGFGPSPEESGKDAGTASGGAGLGVLGGGSRPGALP